MRVMIAEDEPIIGGFIAEQVKALGGTVLGVVSDSEEGRRLIREERPDVLLLDVDLRDGPTGPLLADRRICGEADVLFLTAHDSVDLGIGQQPREILCKPFSPFQLKKWLQAAKQRRAA